MKPIAICENKRMFDHYTLWTSRFISYCKENNIPYEIVDCYKSEIISDLYNFSALVWHYQNYVVADLLESRNIIQAADNMGLVTFPSPKMNWHFDDKIAEMYALESVNAPIPNSWVFYEKEKCLDWLKTQAKYPIVAKLRCGSGSNNVKLIRSKEEGVSYAHRMFSKGFDPSPSIAYKAYSKLQSSKDLNMIISRIKKIPQFLKSRKNAKMMPIEKGYCYFQEFIPNNGYDLKVVVIGDKMTFCARNVRKNDFRASGGGDFYYDRSLLTDQIIDIAYAAADKLNMECVGFDFVVNKTNGESKIIEMCYGFDYEVQKDLGAYVDREHQWHEESVCVPDEIIQKIVGKVNCKI